MQYEELFDVETAKERFAGNYAMYSKFLFSFPTRAPFSTLKEQVEAGDAAQAFETAHAMKGIVGYLSLKKVEETLLPVVEVLRAGALPDDAQWTALKDAYQVTVEGIDALKQEATPLF